MDGRRFRQGLSACSGAIVREGSMISFLAAFGLETTLFRIWLTYSLYTRETVPSGFDPEIVPPISLWRYFITDLGTGLVLALPVAFLAVLSGIPSRRGHSPGARKPVRLTVVIAADALLLLSALITVSHLHLLFELDRGLTAAFVKQVLSETSLADLLRLVKPLDVIFLLSPVACFHLLRSLRRILGGKLTLAFAAVGTLAISLFLQPQRDDLAPVLTRNPVLTLARSTGRLALDSFRGGEKQPWESWACVPSTRQMGSLELLDPAFFSSPSQGSRKDSFPRPVSSMQWNVVLFILESVGSAYTFDTSLGNAVPMPFLERIAGEGFTLANHYSTSNYSAYGVFSILTGLYPPPGQFSLVTSAQAAVPALNRFLGDGYHSFFVTPSRASFYFPKSLLVNNGMKEIYDHNSIPAGANGDLDPFARNEITAVDFFMQRLDHAPQPFLAVYGSYLAHWNYEDYGAQYRILPDLNNKRHRYYNNLRTLDALLERVYEHLKANGLLDNSILVFVGDHGESFGQHPGFLAHGDGTFDESYKTPAIFYQPQLFKAGRVLKVTCHADLVPTLLDLMGHALDGVPVQGESALRDSSRKYVFVYSGRSDYLALIENNGRKVAMSLERHDAYAYDLLRDPAEMCKLDAERFPEELKALILFRSFQTRVLTEYNSRIGRERNLQ